MPADLITEQGPTSVPVFAMRDDEEITLGRDTSNSLVLFDRHVSRRHAVIRARSGRFFLFDYGSCNGTRLDGRLVECETPLRDGQVVRTGGVILRFVNRSECVGGEVRMEPAWLSANDRAVVRVAESVQQNGFADLPILADALEDAGCNDREILDHCRNLRQNHQNRCWVLDLILPPVALSASGVSTARLPGFVPEGQRNKDV